MANELPNAVVLMHSQEFHDWCMAAGVYQARLVISEGGTVTNHAIRLKMAQDVIVTPALIANQLVSLIATDPSVNSLGSDVTTIGQAVILQKVADVWTDLAKLLYPQG